MLEALWSIEFLSNVGGFGSGVVVLETGRILGGDAQYFYVGSYSVENHTIRAKVKVTHYSGQPFTVFGQAKEVTLNLTGTPAQDTFEVSGTVSENPTLSISIRFTRRAELP